ncbi:hypothetical protein AURDEDRAFT_131543 [Auricularia subglabra TFB-10046 SS5]|uniref:Uncharacterized protein n=1 Tax=Auricularia subglabra (strain TFB-10046 / SS5) TaxID=717982 RepID=J0D4N0_AURST|nr:hypothetical protein AURDEDRAFT_131543 [Auricularia subglabra TFB-10046 SS5]
MRFKRREDMLPQVALVLTLPSRRKRATDIGQRGPRGYSPPRLRSTCLPNVNELLEALFQGRRNVDRDTALSEDRDEQVGDAQENDKAGVSRVEEIDLVIPFSEEAVVQQGAQRRGHQGEMVVQRARRHRDHAKIVRCENEKSAGAAHGGIARKGGGGDGRSRHRCKALMDFRVEWRQIHGPGLRATNPRGVNPPLHEMEIKLTTRTLTAVAGGPDPKIIGHRADKRTRGAEERMRTEASAAGCNLKQRKQVAPKARTKCEIAPALAVQEAESRLTRQKAAPPVLQLCLRRMWGLGARKAGCRTFDQREDQTMAGSTHIPRQPQAGEAFNRLAAPRRSLPRILVRRACLETTNRQCLWSRRSLAAAWLDVAKPRSKYMGRRTHNALGNSQLRPISHRYREGLHIQPPYSAQGGPLHEHVRGTITWHGAWHGEGARGEEQAGRGALARPGLNILLPGFVCAVYEYLDMPVATQAVSQATEFWQIHMA